ncbi:MAG: outer membrane lipoprotein carrier protein LolA [Candidatus Cryptobacteroides sp.]
MKHLLLTLAALVAFLAPDNVDPVMKAFSRMASANCVSFEYSFSGTGSGKMKVSGSGRAEVSGDAFRVEGNGMEISCDGTSRWVADHIAEEVVIEPVDPQSPDFLVNPALLIVYASDAFETVRSEKAVFGGRNCRRVDLKPVVDAGVRSVSIFFDGDVPAGAKICSSDGTEMVFNISNLDFSPLKGAPSYRPSGFPSSWVVTDLR